MQAMRAKDLNEMFPVVDEEASSPRGFANLLWKQLDHLGYVSHSDPQARFQLFFCFLRCDLKLEQRFHAPPAGSFPPRLTVQERGVRSGALPGT
jgi:hypothetical protein